MSSPKITRVVEGTCRLCQTTWRIEFLSGEEVWEPTSCPACLKKLDVKMGVVRNDNEPLLYTALGERLES